MVLSPGPAGVSYRALESLRSSPKISRVVYVTPRPGGTAAQFNFRDLVRGNRQATGPSFKLKEAVPVDMYPGTHCCEHVFVFER